MSNKVLKLGEYVGSLNNPVNEKIIDTIETANYIIKEMNPSSGIWLVTLYVDDECTEQMSCFTKNDAMGNINRFFIKGTMKCLNFNALAWKMPKHGNRYEYQPNDKYYVEIMEWLANGDVRWENKDENVISKRISFLNSTLFYSEWDVKLTIYNDTKGISYRFIENYVYETAVGWED